MQYKHLVNSIDAISSLMQDHTLINQMSLCV